MYTRQTEGRETSLAETSELLSIDSLVSCDHSSL